MASKEELKGRLATTDKLGESFTSMFNAAEMEASQCEGGQRFLKAAAETVVENLLAHVERDLEQGADAPLPFPSGGTDLEIKAYVNRYIVRAGEGMLNLAEKAGMDAQTAKGMKLAYENALTTIRKEHTANLSSAAFQQAVETRREEVLAGTAVGDTPEEQSFLERIRAAEDPMEVSGSGSDGRHTKEERKLVTLELQRREKKAPEKAEPEEPTAETPTETPVEAKTTVTETPDATVEAPKPLEEDKDAEPIVLKSAVPPKRRRRKRAVPMKATADGS